MSAPALSTRIARAALALRWELIPVARQARARRSAADFLACVHAGMQRAEIAPTLLIARTGDTPVQGATQRFSPGGAALVAGTAGALLQLHDAFPEGGNHPSSTVIPAILALCSRSPATGERALTALIAGYDVANHVALASFPAQQRAGATPTSVAGVVGATVAAGLVLGLNEAKLAAAIGLAAMLGPVTPLQALLDHGDATPMHGGLAARAGVEAAILASAGASCGALVLEGAAGSPGWLGMLHVDPTALSPESWDGRTIDRVVWKLFPACFSSQMSIATALRAPPLDPEAIAAVAIDLPSAAIALVGQGPRQDEDLYDRLMSVRWATAHALVHGKYDIESAYAKSSPSVAALMAKTTTHACADLDRLAAGTVGGRIRIQFHNGEQVVLRHERSLHGPSSDNNSQGWCTDPGDPALDQKIADLTGPTASIQGARADFRRNTTSVS